MIISHVTVTRVTEQNSSDLVFIISTTSKISGILLQAVISHVRNHTNIFIQKLYRFSLDVNENGRTLWRVETGDTDRLSLYSAGARHCTNVESALIQYNDVESMLIQCCHNVLSTMYVFFALYPCLISVPFPVKKNDRNISSTLSVREEFHCPIFHDTEDI